MNHKMSIRDVGPRFALVSILIFVCMLLIHCTYTPLVTIDIVSRNVLLVIGIVLVSTGVLFFAWSVITIHRSFKKGTLITWGPFSIVRHPVYGAWIVLIMPGIALMYRSWILLVVPILMYSAFRLLINREEGYLRERFGTQYVDYKVRVGALLPRLRR